MPPRIQSLQRLSSFSLCLRPAAKPATPNFLPIVQTANISAKEAKRRQRLDPYRWQQAQQRKAVNVKRQEELKAERDTKWGDPVHGIPTPFVESFDSAGQATLSTPEKDADGNPITEPYPLPTSPHILNNLLTREELDSAIQHAYVLSKPVKSEIRDLVDPEAERQAEKEHEEKHKRAVEAMNRIVSMDNANSKMRRHANVRRCIETFGRHNTDKTLKPRPASIDTNPYPMPERCGPDTGSSEVQIAILTVKARKLAQELGQNRGYKDKHNKRNLRVLLHKRQRLLRYMERKERGSERWTHMLETLGLTPATWKKQISL
ncbi:hypothetical protein SODALDRAFT_326585 [Sodiomyces alkalinus F11]|uniref:Ribosomal protein S15 n=1 Tax=Sodiomyces alkalinus (strain CBS 110278 / VKM F-3762 / F11) TaxID=1314773 RepID=A0A3N2Q6Y2_SODAK|nr:hypothetical protein SODALDRAFT_326585 [Sodiomyces alkalinus F11]ROT42418.1 hypothetical protein SODALDRAFT_326585 [Sodiomyces alkalinus F11]